MRLLLILWISLYMVPAHGQVDTLPYDQWISDLSVNEDRGSRKLFSVISTLYAIDSLNICGVFGKLRSKVKSDNPRLKIRLMLIEAKTKPALTDLLDCSKQRDKLLLYHEALKMAYEQEDIFLTFQVYRDLTSYYTINPKPGQAVLYALLAKDLYDQYGREKLYPIAPILYNLSFNFYHAHEYRTSIDIIEKIFSHGDNGYLAKGDTLGQFFDMFSYNTLGLCYSKLGILDSAFMAFDSALILAEETNRPFWKSLITGNKGDIYFQQGQYDSAEVMLLYDYEGSISANEFDNAANSLQWLARIDLVHHKVSEALQKTREAQQLLQKSYHPDYMANTLLTFTKIFASLGKADSVTYYMEKYITLHDSIQQKVTEGRIENVTARLESLENVHSIESLKKEKQRISLIRNFIIALILLCTLVGFMVLNRQKLKLKVRRQEALEALRLAEQDSINAKEQLTLYTRNLLEKTTLVETLQAQLLERELTDEQKVHITELSNHAILTDDDWERFKELFQKVYPGFFFNLKLKVPDLTSADQRMAAICKLQLSNKEAATLLGIAPNSVIKAKQRLRHRFGLNPEADLELYFAQSKEFN